MTLNRYIVSTGPLSPRHAMHYILITDD